jgi:hypothetical protein
MLSVVQESQVDVVEREGAAVAMSEINKFEASTALDVSTSELPGVLLSAYICVPFFSVYFPGDVSSFEERRRNFNQDTFITVFFVLQEVLFEVRCVVCYNVPSKFPNLLLRCPRDNCDKFCCANCHIVLSEIEDTS